jgi:acyl-CoA dehydrogenase family protein 11
VDREFRILDALHKVGYPVPRPLHFCGDKSVIGTEFYLMDFVDGRIFRDPSLGDCSPAERAAIYAAMAATLAHLHTLDPARLGLADLARPGSFADRQIKAWSQA